MEWLAGQAVVGGCFEPEQWDERIRLLHPYQVNAEVVKQTGNPHVGFLHCLPSLRNRDTVVGEQLYQRTGRDGLEVTDEVFESRNSLVFAADPAFGDPTKFVGPVYAEDDAKRLAAESTRT